MTPERTACRLTLQPDAETRAAPPAPQERRATPALAPGACGATHQGARASGRRSPSLAALGSHRLCECDLVAPAQTVQGHEECGLAWAQADHRGNCPTASGAAKTENACTFGAAALQGARRRNIGPASHRRQEGATTELPASPANFAPTCCPWRRRWGRRPCALPARCTAAFARRLRATTALQRVRRPSPERRRARTG